MTITMMLDSAMMGNRNTAEQAVLQSVHTATAQDSAAYMLYHEACWQHICAKAVLPPCVALDTRKGKDACRASSNSAGVQGCFACESGLLRVDSAHGWQIWGQTLGNQQSLPAVKKAMRRPRYNRKNKVTPRAVAAVRVIVCSGWCSMRSLRQWGNGVATRIRSMRFIQRGRSRRSVWAAAQKQLSCQVATAAGTNAASSCC